MLPTRRTGRQMMGTCAQTTREHLRPTQTLLATSLRQPTLPGAQPTAAAAMAKLMKMLQPLQSEYVDRRFDGTKEEYFKQLEMSSTLYIGNLSFYTTEDQIYELFSKVGAVARVIVGLDRNTKTPCGFAFVLFHTRQHARDAVTTLNGTKLDSRQLRVDVDPGFEEGRQYGRGRSGGQVRDEFRTDFDADRGGYGRVVAAQLAAQQLAMWQEVQAGASLGSGLLPGGAVFFGQAQRRQAGTHGDEEQQGGDEQQEQEQQEGEQLQQQPDGVQDNPRLRGRGQQDEEDDVDWEAQLQQRKRRRVGNGGGAPLAAGAAHDEGADEQPGDADAPPAVEDEEQEQQQEQPAEGDEEPMA